MPVPYTFGTATAAIPLSQLDSNFATAITLGNTAVYLGNTTTSIGNLTLTNVTISSGEVTTGNVSVSGNVTLTGGTANGVAYLNGSKVLTTGSALVFDGTKLGIASGNIDVVSPNFSGAPLISARFNSSNDRIGFNIGNSNGFPFLGYNVNNATSSDSGTFDRNGYATRLRLDNGKFQFETSSASGTAGNAITFNTPMTLDASGNLGIGTSSPLSRLDVRAPAGELGRFAISNTGVGYLVITGGASTTEGLRLSYDNTDGSSNINNFFNAALKFSTNNTVHMRLDSSGNLLVGTTSGSTHIIEKSNASSTVLSIINSSATSPSGAVFNFSAAAPNNGTQTFWTASDNAAYRGGFLSNGGLQNYQSNDSNLSDRREKTNFAPAKSYLDAICSIPVQTFNYIDQNMEDDGGLTLGVVAQDVQAVAPELVMESNWATEGQEPKMRLSIYQTDLQYALMKCIQEQQALITQLTARITALEGA